MRYAATAWLQHDRSAGVAFATPADYCMGSKSYEVLECQAADRVCWQHHSESGIGKLSIALI